MRVLEITPENGAALLLGLEYLIGISYVDDTEVFKVGMLKYICHIIIAYVRSLRTLEFTVLHFLIKLYRSAWITGMCLSWSYLKHTIKWNLQQL